MSKEALYKADLALSDLTGSSNGGLLNPEQNDRFIRIMQDQPTILNEVRIEPMNSPKKEINKIGFDKMIVKPAVQTAGSRALGSGDRSKPDTSKVELSTKEVIAEVHIPYEVLEDNIERGDLTNTILDLIAERWALDMEHLIINGDTGTSPASGEELLEVEDGLLVRTTTNTVDVGGAGGIITPAMFNDMINALPSKYLRNRSQWRFYVNHVIEQNYRLKLSTKESGLGDTMLTGATPVNVFAIPMKAAALLPTDNIILTNPQNLILGIQRNMRIESEKMISERQIKIVVTGRVAFNVEEEPAIVKLSGLD